MPDGKGGFTGSWKFSGNAEAVFQAFFGAHNPFSDVFSEYGSYGSAEPFNPNLRVPRKMPTVTHALPCTMEELYAGCTKRITTERRRFSADGVLRAEQKVLAVEVRAGYRHGTKITFPGEGDEEVDTAPADVCFQIDERPHAHFTRGSAATAAASGLGPLDLAHTAEVSLADALAGATVQLTTLDGRLLSIPIPEIVYPGYVKVVHGEGMPSTKTGGGSAPVARGDLRLTLRVRFPQDLSAQQKKDVRKALAGC